MSMEFKREVPDRPGWYWVVCEASYDLSIIGLTVANVSATDPPSWVKRYYWGDRIYEPAFDLSDFLRNRDDHAEQSTSG